MGAVLLLDDPIIETHDLEASSNLILRCAQTKIATARTQPFACSRQDTEAGRVEEGHGGEVPHDPTVERVKGLSQLLDGCEVDLPGDDDHGRPATTTGPVSSANTWRSR